MVFLPEASDFIARDVDVPKLARPLGLPSGRNEFVEGIQTVAREERIYVNVGVHELPRCPKRHPTTNLILPLLIDVTTRILSSLTREKF